MIKPVRTASVALALLATSLTFTSTAISSEIEGAEDENFVGRSLGGNVRQGPGLGYDWFEVRFDDGTEGFMWGGILCSSGQLMADVYQQCVN